MRGWRDERVEVGIRCRDRVKKGTKCCHLATNLSVVQDQMG